MYVTKSLVARVVLTTPHSSELRNVACTTGFQVTGALVGLRVLTGSLVIGLRVGTGLLTGLAGS